MKNADSLDKLQQKLKKVLLTSQENLYAIREKCVKDNRFTFSEIFKITTGETPIETLSDAQLYWLLEISNKQVTGLGKAETYFTDAEITSHKFYSVITINPKDDRIMFKNVTCLTPNASDKRQFGMYLSVEDIARLKENGQLQVVPELQREGKRDRYGELKTKVNPTRRAEITNSIESGSFFYNSISITLVDDDEAKWYYDEDKNQIVIEKGTLIIPDGNHRSIACEFVDKNNIHATDRFHVLFTFLSPQDTQRKIAQECNTEPINKKHWKSLQITVANQIVDSIKRSPDCDEFLKVNIVTTGTQIKSNEGFVIYSVLSDAIEKYYDTKSLTTKEEQNEVARWLVDFFNRILYVYKEDFHNFKDVKRRKWNVSPYAFVGYTKFSSYLYSKKDGDWRSELDSLLAQIDFDETEELKKNKSDKAYAKYVDSVFGEVLLNAKS